MTSKSMWARPYTTKKRIQKQRRAIRWRETRIKSQRALAKIDLWTAEYNADMEFIAKEERWRREAAEAAKLINRLKAWLGFK
jgi:hypothetical protein